MKNIIIVTITVLALVACKSTREVMDSWLGHTKHDLIMKWGSPARTASDGENGEILVDAKPVYIPETTGLATPSNPNPSTSPGKTFWDYKMFWVNSDGKIYHWMTQRQQVPPQQIDLNVYFRN